MAAQTGHVTPGNKIIDFGDPEIKIEKNVETVANVYPGRLVAKGTTDYDVKVADGVLAVPVGWALFEHTSDEYQKDLYTTIYTVSDKIMVGRGGNFSIYAWLPKYWSARQGDKMFSWIGGQVVPGYEIDGQPALAIAFAKAASAADTGIDLAAGMVVSGCRILVETLVGSGWIDVGIGLAESGYDADGFVDGEATTAAGLISHINYTATDANHTLGVLISTTIKSADTTALYARLPDDYKCDGTCVSIEYTTSDHTQAGRILLIMNNPGITYVGDAEETVDASSAAKRIWVRNKL